MSAGTVTGRAIEPPLRGPRIPFTGALTPVLSIAAALALGGAIIAISGRNVIDAGEALVSGVFADEAGFRDAMDNAAVLILTALAVSLPVRAGLFNIGGEGQLLVGALAASIVALQLGSLPWVAAVPLSITAAAAGGGLWGLIPGYLRGLGTNEIITTLMFNFIALWGIVALIGGPLQAPDGLYAQTEIIPGSAHLPNFPGTIVDTGIVVALVAAAVVLLLERHTVLGLELRLLGSSADAARFAGVPVRRKIMLAMFLSGGLAGLGGATQLLGVQFQVTQEFSSGFGFLGIAIAFLGGTSPIGIVLAGLFFGALTAGGTSMEQVAGVPSPVVPMIEGLAFVFILFALANRARRQEAR